ncbi:hypothetical protein [Hyunsoonleella ulvae]|uniref:hypothetical protein n=1 Tax=Hyunsoonleella ulvae TaxID=2799948 RepID=UPI0019394DCA|nr:hypothetical protein [Hyunsoonleella ulvae]
MEESKTDIEDKKEVKRFDFAKIERNIDSIKKVIPILILIPTIIGGLWQFLSLLKLGANYIRFFSLSQLISDGITLLLPLAMIFGILYFLYRGSFKFFKDYNPERSDKIFNRIFLSIIFILSLCFLIWFSSLSILYKIGKIDKFPSVNSAFLFYVFIIPAIIFNYNSEYFILKFLNLKHKLIEYILLITMFVRFWAGICYFFLLLYLISFLSDYSIPKNLININNIEKSIKIDYGYEPENYEVSYMNDNYVFIEYFKISKEERKKLVDEDKSIPSEIIIYKIDELFNIKRKNEVIEETISDNLILNDSI